MRVSQEPGFILHSYSYRESSQIIEVFTRHYGRASLLAKGSRRWKKRGTKTYLRPFQEFVFSWSGRGELATLTGAEEVPPARSLGKSGLYCGFYLNELLIRLLHRHDEHERLYDFYHHSLSSLANEEGTEAILRIFEKKLLLETGYGLNLETDISNGKPIEAGRRYQYLLNQGPTSMFEVGLENSACEISGQSLVALKTEDIDDPVVMRELKQLMRRVIDHQLNYKPLASRSMFASVQSAESVKLKGVSG